MGGRKGSGGSRANGATGERPKVTIERSSTVNDAMRTMYGRVLTDAELARLATIGDGGTVRVDVAWNGAINLVGSHPDYRTTRVLFKDSIRNDSFFIRKDKTGSGIGSRMFKAQVDQATKLGFRKITTHAGGGPKAAASGGMNGYYTWARLGYNAKITSVRKRSFRTKVAKAFPKAKTIGDLMKTAKGRQFWKDNGSNFDGTFDLNKGSTSQRRLSAYMREKRKRS